MKVLFIGRFQPFHNGHLELIKNIKDKYDEIIIGIGSSQYSYEIHNPFSVEERKLMIEKSLKLNRIDNYVIIEIPDIHNYPKWVSHVESLVSDFDVVISNSKLTTTLFNNKGYKVIKTKFYNRNNYSGKKIRENIITNKPWEQLIPKTVVDIIKEINGVKRIKNLYKKNNSI
jgi:nicotinamide-nucleotide adenylyltransferase